jgi:ribosomal protein S18 acetylase RimI-like enzyme
VIRKPIGAVQGVTTQLGLLRTRPQTDADESFLSHLFESVKGADFAQMPISPAAQLHLLQMQYHAMNESYRASYPDAAFEIITLDDMPIGRLICDAMKDRLQVVYIAFVTDWRHRGLGTTLMRVLLEQAESLHLDCQATVAIDNLPSLGLWAKLGFFERSRDAVNVVVVWQPAVT